MVPAMRTSPLGLSDKQVEAGTRVLPKGNRYQLRLFRVAPMVLLARHVPAPRSNQVFGLLRPPGARWVVVKGGRLLEHLLHELPGSLDSVTAREQRALSKNRIVNQVFVCAHDLGAVGGVVLKTHPRGSQLDLRAVLLSEKGQRDSGLLAELKGEMVALEPDGFVLTKHLTRWLLERKRYGLMLLLESLAGSHEERHSGPPPVVDEHARRNEGLRVAVRIDTLLIPVTVVLPAHLSLIHISEPTRLR